MSPLILVLVLFSFGVVIGAIIAAHIFRPRWVDVKADDIIDHKGLIILHYRSGQLVIYRNYYKRIDSKSGVKRYMKL